MNLPRLRAPEQDGATLAHPPLSRVPDLMAANRAAFDTAAITLDGMPLHELRHRAAVEVLEAARAYFSGRGEPISEWTGASLLLAGHQPDLFHPGVWLKHFALNQLARQTGTVPLNLVVDNDTTKTTAIRVPIWSDNPAQVRLANVAFDHFAGEVPYEERDVIDWAQFASFAERVGALTRGWPFKPLLPRIWRDVTALGKGTIGERFAAARRSLERAWGCHNLEISLSRLCQTDAFLTFARAVLGDLPRFHATYNECVRAYRREHRIRSRNHPVPDLARDGEWLEAPFWGWRTGGRRARLFVRVSGDRFALRAGADDWGFVPASGPLDDWRALEADGRKLRTRALTTTLFARLVLADLFIHGIGGGKYDELTDAIIRRHFGVQPPSFLIVTGTLTLPLPRPRATVVDLHAAERAVRDLTWNPQRHLSANQLGDPAVQKLMGERWRLEGAQPASRTERANRFSELRALTEQLRGRIAERRATAQDRRDRVRDQVAANAVLSRRDYSFCLHPEGTLRPFLTQSFGSS